MVQVGNQISCRGRLIMIQTRAEFIPQYLFTALFYPIGNLLVALCAFLDLLDSLWNVVRQNQHVVACQKRHIRHAVSRHRLRHTFHVESVGEDQTFKAHLILQ